MTTSSNQYPFTTKKQIVQLIAAGDPSTLTRFAALMQDRTDRRDSDPTLKRCGWMSSHERRGRVCGTAAQEAVASDEHLGGEALQFAQEIVGSYPKQIAAELRSQALKEGDSDLNATAAVFGVSE